MGFEGFESVFTPYGPASTFIDFLEIEDIANFQYVNVWSTNIIVHLQQKIKNNQKKVLCGVIHEIQSLIKLEQLAEQQNSQIYSAYHYGWNELFCLFGKCVKIYDTIYNKSQREEKNTWTTPNELKSAINNRSFEQFKHIISDKSIYSPCKYYAEIKRFYCVDNYSSNLSVKSALENVIKAIDSDDSHYKYKIACAIEKLNYLFWRDMIGTNVYDVAVSANTIVTHVLKCLKIEIQNKEGLSCFRYGVRILCTALHNFIVISHQIMG